jgi:hypothetical protein
LAIIEFGDGAGNFGYGSAEPLDRSDDDGTSWTGVLEHGSQSGPGCHARPREFVGKHPIRIDPSGG